MKIEFRRAVEADVELIFGWRNHQLVRQVSIDPNEISWADHQVWFRHSLERSDRTLLIACIEGVPVGVLRFDVIKNVAEVSIYLDPEKIGKGLGTEILRDGIAWARRSLADVTQFQANIRENNKASIRLFEKIGFAESWRVYTLKK
jgi:UDP-2,4-diacetamido-2,4,6-trideoxy-beta-L-altropyranose hydrolase